MSRTVRKVPANWEHPKHFNHRGDLRFKPLFAYSFSEMLAEWEEGKSQWEKGFKENWGDSPKWVRKTQEDEETSWEDWGGERPIEDDFMPQWTPEEATHFMMYETTSEGTPISPAFANIEDLARWLADTGASALLLGVRRLLMKNGLELARGGSLFLLCILKLRG